MKIRPVTIERLQALSLKTRKYNDNPESIPAEERGELSLMFAATFKDFKEFCILGMRFLGFSTTGIQLEIAEFMQHGGNNIMVMAQRGQAKSTIAALYAVWELIQDPTRRVLVVSGGEAQASDVAGLIIRIIMNWHLLCWLRPDRSKGDRTSFEHFDVHYSLKGVEKSASVACVGITANLQGKRSDLLIADDVETQKNSLTQTMRDTLLLLSKEFTAIVADAGGRQLYLGTPQTKESIYRTLPGRGFTVRIWPGRYPTPAEELHYLSGTLAPSIISKLRENPALATGGGISGKLGQCTDPERYSEEQLVEKELQYGPEGFSLQYMLDTTLSDAMRTRIKLEDLMLWDGDYNVAPIAFQRSAEVRHRYIGEFSGKYGLDNQVMYHVASTSTETLPYTLKIGNIDPAGNGGDEISYAFGGAAGQYVHCFCLGGLRGGLTKENINYILDKAVEFGLQKLWIEKNMGHGTVEQLFIAECTNRVPKLNIGIEGYYAVGQKEARIIDTISPLARRHRLIWHMSALEEDYRTCEQHSTDRRTVANGLYQMANITYDRGSLSMDDRADAVAGLCRHLNEVIIVDTAKEVKKQTQDEFSKFMQNPLDLPKHVLQSTQIKSKTSKWRFR